MRRSGVFVGLALIVIATACSQSTQREGGITSGETTIKMRDSLFSPNELTVRRGQEVMFRFENDGKLRHDAFIGDEDAQNMHEDEMRMADDEEGHVGHVAEEENAITVEPGKSGTITYRFTEEGETVIGCHEPGHYAARMFVRVTVS